MTLNRFHFLTILLFVTISILSCGQKERKEGPVAPKVESRVVKKAKYPATIFKNDNLEIVQLTKHCLQHISYLETQDYGKVGCNGMVVMNGGEAVILDTPVNDRSSKDLIQLLNRRLHMRVKVVVPTHFHADCWGGIKAFTDSGIPIIAEAKNLELRIKNGKKIDSLTTGFKNGKVLDVGGEKLVLKYFGAGHTIDNIVAYYEDEEVLFGGCLIKSLNAGKGNLEDANVAQWPITVEKIIARYPNLKFVVPGHGKAGDKELLTYTKQLFSE